MTDIINLQSIYNNGLIPNTSPLGHFDNPVIYAWKDELVDNKYIADFVYCKMYIQPMNTLLDVDEMINESYSYEYWENKIKQLIFPREIIMAILTIDNSVMIYNEPIHDQSRNMSESWRYGSEFWKNFDLRYAHTQKPLIIYNNNISPDKLHLIGYAMGYWENNKVETVIKLIPEEDTIQLLNIDTIKELLRG